MLEHERPTPLEHTSFQKEVSPDLETPEGVVQWLSVFIPYFFTVELPLQNISVRNNKERMKTVDSLRDFAAIFSLMRYHFSNCQIFWLDMKMMLSEEDYEHKKKKVKDQQKMTRRLIAKRSDQMMEMGMLAKDFHVPKKLPDEFVMGNEAHQMAQQERIFFLNCYLHDMGSIVAHIRGSIDLFLERIDKGKKMSDEEIQNQISYLQSEILDLVVMNEGFDVTNEQMSNKKESVSFLLAYIRKVATRENSNTQNRFIKKADKVDLSLHIESDWETSQQLEDIEVALPIPSFLRIYTNVMQNIKRYYQNERKSSDELPLLRVQIKVETHRFILVFDDDGDGFPINQKLTTEELVNEINDSPLNWKQLQPPAHPKPFVERSALDDEPIIPFTLKKKVSKKGSGIGLSGIQEAIQRAGGSFLVGNRTSSQGARVELVLLLD